MIDKINKMYYNPSFMKKTIIYSLFTLSSVLSLAFGTPFVASAQTTPFTVSLGYTSTNTAEVVKLQNFLINQGLLHTAATGKYLTLTQKAVAAFQVSQGITPSAGYFGVITQAAANKVLAGTVSIKTPGAKPTTISSVSITNTHSNLATVFLSNQKTLTWKTSDYPANVGVNINLLRMVSTSPKSYTLVRTLKKDTPNDGKEVWTPSKNETGDDMYIEITCSTDYTFKNGCQFTGAPTQVQ